MNDTEFDQWIQTVRRRPLTAAEQSQLEAFLLRAPEYAESWNEEEALTRLLLGLPDPPVSSNFTSRVLEAALTTDTGKPVPFPGLSWLRLPRPALALASAALILVLGALGFLRHEERAETQWVNSVADFSRQIEMAANATDLPPVELLRDFDAIYCLSQPQSLPDEELLAALQ